MKRFLTPNIFLGLAVIALLSSGVSGMVFSHIGWLWQATLGIAVAALLGFVLTGRSEIAVFFGRRATKYGLNSVIMSVVVLAIIVVVNLIASSHDIKKDVTKNKLHTLSEQSIKVVKGLTEDVTLRLFVSPMQIQEFDPVLDKYTYYSDKLKREYVDVDKDPIAVQRNNIKQAGTILVESKTRTARVENLTGPDDPKIEERITNAIIQVAKGEKKKAYFVTGHGERLLSDTGREGFSEVKTLLEEGRYNVLDLQLVEKAQIPKDADLVVIAAPRTQWIDAEYKALEDYLKSGGNVLVMLEPTSSNGLQTFLAKYGIDWKHGKTIVETNRLQQLAGGNPLTPIVTSYDATHEITKDARQLTIFPVATPVEKAAPSPPDFTVTSLFSTSDRSFEVDLKGDKVVVDQSKDRRGPISLAIAVTGKLGDSKPEKSDEKVDKATKKDREFRLVVVGDADFAANGARSFGINADIFQNMLSWLSNEEDLISIRPRPTDVSEFDLTAQRASVINLVSIFVAPFAMFIAGIAVWITRKKK